MISKFEELNELFKELDETMSDKVSFYVLGGATLLYHELKDSTKDIDVVVYTEEEYSATENSLKNLGFMVKTPTLGQRNVKLSQILHRDDFRIDLFSKVVCKGFGLSETMKTRALKVLALKNITVLLCSLEDIFLFKTFTDREGDLEDCISIAKKGIDWKVVLDELKKQITYSGKDVWITWVGERLDILVERGLEIPIMKDVDKLREKYFEEFEKTHPDKFLGVLKDVDLSEAENVRKKANTGWKNRR